jgi:hypothetical protein
MLNLENGKAIAIIHGGKYDSEIIYIDEDEDNEDRYTGEYPFKDRLLLPKNSKLFPLVDLNSRQVAYIAGPSGSGKSTYASNLAKKYEKLYPDNFIYLFSRVIHDPVFESGFKKKPVRIEINDDLIKRPIDIMSHLKGGALVIFDDIDSIHDDKLKKEVIKLETDILEMGRHNNIYVICCNHLINPNERKFGRTILNEAHTFTFFPKSGSTYQISYCLRKYFGLDNKLINYLLNFSKSRWVTISKSYPMYVLWEYGAGIL